MLQTGNTSLGVTLLAHLVREAAARLDADWDNRVLEMHHRMKVDSPSGTALLLGQAAAGGAASASTAAPNVAAMASPGRVAVARSASHRCAAGPSRATADVRIFAGPEEMITLSHRAENRMIFARGAVQTATMADPSAAGPLRCRRCSASERACGAPISVLLS